MFLVPSCPFRRIVYDDLRNVSPPRKVRTMRRIQLFDNSVDPTPLHEIILILERLRFVQRNLNVDSAFVQRRDGRN